MPLVLTMPDTVRCGHTLPPKLGIVTTSSAAKLKVNGNAVLLMDSIASKSVADCATVAASDVSGPTAKPCTAVSAVTAGQSLKLKVGGQPVMLATLKGSTDGMVAKIAPQILLAGLPNQTKLNSV